MLNLNLNILKKKLIKYVAGLELILALCIVLSIAIGLITIAKYLVLILQTDVSETYFVIKKFLALALLLVIGVELVLMLLSHSTSSILELVLFAIARKMLVYSETMMDLLIGTAAIAIVFLIRRFLLMPTNSLQRDVQVISAASPVHAINFGGELVLPEDKGSTLEALICNLSDETCIPLEVGSEYEVSNVRMKILKIKDGIVDQVAIKKIKDKDSNDSKGE